MNAGRRLGEQLRALEEQLLDSSVRSSPQALDALLADDFVEFGSSGTVYDKQQTVEALSREPQVRRVLTQFAVRSLSADLALVTYRVTRTDWEGESSSLRSSIWRLEDGRWRLAFHQGTLIRTGW